MRFLVVDDHPLFREVVCNHLAALDPRARMFEASNGAEALAVIRQQRSFSLILLDLCLPGPSGPALLSEIKSLAPSTPVVFFSATEHAGTASELIAQGARGYVSKTAPPHEFVNALRLALSGVVYVSPSLLAASDNDSQAPSLGSDSRPIMTPRQQEVLEFLQKGLPNKSIAKALDCSEGTVKLHVSGILRSLQARNRTEAVSLALELGLLDAPPGH